MAPLGPGWVIACCCPTEAARSRQLDDPWPFGLVVELKGRYRLSLDEEDRAVFGRRSVGKAAG